MVLSVRPIGHMDTWILGVVDKTQLVQVESNRTADMVDVESGSTSQIEGEATSDTVSQGMAQ